MKNGQTVNIGRTTNSYNNSGNHLIKLYETWSNNAWINSWRNTWTYDNSGNSILNLEEEWSNNAWVNNNRDTNTYDNYGNCLTNLYEEWSNNAWTNIYIFSYVFDNNGNCIHGEFYLYPGTIGMANVTIQLWYNHHQNSLSLPGFNSIDVEYTTITGVSSEQFNNLSFNLQQNYPNPFNPTTTINYSLAKEGNVKLTLYNAIGSKVAAIINEYKPAGNYSVQFDGSKLASGIYLYRLESGNYSAAKKLIIMK